LNPSRKVPNRAGRSLLVERSEKRWNRNPGKRRKSADSEQQFKK
jgi:hypothetical protein